MKKALVFLLINIMLAGCAPDHGLGPGADAYAEQAGLSTRTVLEKYEQGGKRYVSVTGREGSVIRVEIEERLWEEVKKGGTVTFDRDWNVMAIDGDGR